MRGWGTSPLTRGDASDCERAAKGRRLRSHGGSPSRSPELRALDGRKSFTLTLEAFATTAQPNVYLVLRARASIPNMEPQKCSLF